MDTTFPKVYKVVDPAGKSFFAAIIVNSDDTLGLLSTRDGKWAPETTLHYADMLMPEQALNDWDVTRVAPGVAPAIPE